MASGLSIKEMIDVEGLGANLVLCLDAADINSYDPDDNAQLWKDTSGQGNNFFLGLNGSSEGFDPEFNGTPGARTENEFWTSPDGGRLFQATADHQFGSSWHKDNGEFTVIGILRRGSASTATFTLLNTVYGGPSAVRGIIVQVLGDTFNRAPRLLVQFSPSGVSLSEFMSSGPDIGADAFVVCAIDEAVGANGLTLSWNETSETFTSTYTTPSSSREGNTYRIGASGSVQFPAGVRLHGLMAWNRKLTVEECLALYTRAARRYSSFPGEFPEAFNLLADKGGYSLTGLASARAIVKPVLAGAYTVTGFIAELIADVEGAIRMTAAAGSYALTGVQSLYQTTGQQAVVLAAEAGAYVAQGLANILAYGRRIQQLLRPKRRVPDALQRLRQAAPKLQRRLIRRDP